jgi:hypothetical protein
MARLGGVCWNGCADLADSCGVARRGTAIAMVGEKCAAKGWTPAGASPLESKQQLEHPDIHWPLLPGSRSNEPVKFIVDSK